MPLTAENISGPPPEVSGETARTLRLLTAPLLLADRHGLIVRVNANLRELFQADDGYFVGRRLNDIAVGERDKVLRTLGLFAASGDWLVGALALRRPDGKTVDFPCKGALVQRPDGTRPALIAIQLDQRLQFDILTRKIEELNAEIRRRVHAEEQLRLYRDHLETLVDRRTAELTESNRRLALANEEIKRASHAKTRFLAAASHDLRQPVQALRLHLHLLAQKTLDDAAMRVVETIDATLNSTESMLGKLMEFAALECGKVSVSRRRFRLDDLIAKVAGEAAPEAEAKGLRIRTRVFPCFTETDPVLLERIIRNLVWNAIRYTTAGGILIGLRRRADSVTVAVCDSGIGIPPNMQAAIFEEFEQLGNLERDRDKGMGLGLAIVNRTASLLGHRLALRSREGRGSIFTLALPRVCAARPPAGDGEEAPREVPPSARILLIEDDALQATALTAILTETGFLVSAARDAVSALEAAQPHGPDLIVSDYRLPGGVSGLEAIQRVRRHLGRAVPAILITGDTQASIAEQAWQEACSIVHKPYSPSSLIEVINRRLADTGKILAATP